MSTIGMCALFYSVTSPSQQESGENSKPNKNTLARSLSTSPKLYSLMPVTSPRQAFQRMIFGVHAKTKRSLAEEAESGDDKSLNAWIKDGVDPNEADSYGYTPLINASTLGRLTAVKELVKNGADINKLGPFEFSALHAAAQNGHREVVAYLLRNGADINAQNVDKDTPMHLALRANRLEVVYQLLSCGGNSRIEGFNNKNCIQCAADAGYVDLVKVLENYSAFNESTSQNSFYHHTPLDRSISVI